MKTSQTESNASSLDGATRFNLIRTVGKQGVYLGFDITFFMTVLIHLSSHTTSFMSHRCLLLKSLLVFDKSSIDVLRPLGT